MIHQWTTVWVYKCYGLCLYYWVGQGHLVIYINIDRYLTTTNHNNALTMRVYNMSRHYSDAILSAMASQITSLKIVYPTVYSSTDQRKHQSSACLAFVRGIHRWPVNSPHKGPVTQKMFPFDDVIMKRQGILPGGAWELLLLISISKSWLILNCLALDGEH